MNCRSNGHDNILCITFVRYILKDHLHTELECHSSEARVEKAADCTSSAKLRKGSLSYLLNRSHEKIFLNILDSFMDRFNLHKTIIKVYMHIASKISVVIQRLSHI